MSILGQVGELVQALRDLEHQIDAYAVRDARRHQLLQAHGELQVLATAGRTVRAAELDAIRAKIAAVGDQEALAILDRIRGLLP